MQRGAFHGSVAHSLDWTAALQHCEDTADPPAADIESQMQDNLYVLPSWKSSGLLEPLRSCLVHCMHESQGL